MNWKIMARTPYSNYPEEIDEFDDIDEARRMMSEYRMAYEAGWGFYLELQH